MAKCSGVFIMLISDFGQALGQAAINEDFERWGVPGLVPFNGAFGFTFLWRGADGDGAGRDVYSGQCR